MKHIFIVNPSSGGGKSSLVMQEIAKICHNEKLDYEIIYTKRPKEAISIARNYSQQNNIALYSVGGDGTLFEVLNGMADSDSLLTVVPAGTGNDFYKTIKDDNYNIKSIDVGKMNDYYFINSSSIGIDAEIANNVSKMKELKVPQSLVYKASILYTYLKFKHPNITHNLETLPKNQAITICAICNGKYYGGGFPIAPNAKVDDGYFDIYLADYISKVSIPGMIFKLVKGTHETSKYVNRYQTDNLTIASNQELICNLDGEIIKGTEFNFQLMKNKVILYNGHPAIKQFIKTKLK